MEDKSNKNEETSNESTEEIRETTTNTDQPDTMTQDKEIKDDQKNEESKEQKDVSKEPVTNAVVEGTSKKESGERPKGHIKDTKQDTDKPKKVEEKKEKITKKADRGPDFKYIVRLSNTDVDGEKSVVYGLTTVKGIGVHMATLIADEVKIDRNKKIGYLSDTQIENIQKLIDNVRKNAPSWMLNHQKDYDTGEDIHLVGSDIDLRLRDEINIMKKIRSYRGIRHERGLPVRGQRTRANSRTGLTLGVSKKRALSKSSGKKE